MSTSDGIVVQKYGGTSVGTPEKVVAVAERIKGSLARAPRLVVVVSAMGSTTDDLVALAHQVSRRPQGREMDLLLASGEQIAVSALGLALQDREVPAISLTAAQCGIRTDGVFNLARIQSIDTRRILGELNAGRVVIITGFQGINDAQEVTTLGRGGSDVTGAAVAAALGATVCEICTDVDGVLSADPRLIANAKVWRENLLRGGDRAGLQRGQGAPPARRGDLHVVRHPDPRALDLHRGVGHLDSIEGEAHGAGGSCRRHQ